MTVYLTNAASRRPPHRGPGRAWTIMAMPRPQYGEAGQGRCFDLIPLDSWVRDAKAGRLTLDEYRGLYMEMVLGDDVSPGALLADDGHRIQPVEDGDTLICCCSRQAAAEDRCHRAWAARALKASGWRVVLDGGEL